MPELQVGPIRDFLLMNFQEDKAQRPEFTLEFKDDGTGGPFAALRRRELVALARKYNIEMNPNIPQTQMVPIMNTAWINGKFPKPKDMAAERFVQNLTPEVLDMISKRLAEGPKLVAERTGPDYSDENEFPWPKLKSIAASRDINTQGMKRPEVEEALYRSDAA